MKIRKNVLVALILFCILLGMFLSAFVSRPDETSEFKKVGKLVDVNSGNEIDLYSYGEITIDWTRFQYLQVRLIIPSENSKNRTSIVFYTK